MQDGYYAGGQLELGPTEFGASYMTPSEQNQFRWNTHRKGWGNCAGYFTQCPVGLPFPEIMPSREKLRNGCCYNTVSSDGTRYSETVEQLGNEKITIEPSPDDIPKGQTPTEIAPNQSVGNEAEATRWLIIKATCDGEPLPDRWIGVRVDVKPRSGGHFHVVKRPRGNLVDQKKIKSYCGVDDTGSDSGTNGMSGWDAPPQSPRSDENDRTCMTVKTDSKGEAKIRFDAPLTGHYDYAKQGTYQNQSGVAGDYKITAKDWRFTDVRASIEISAEVEGLQPQSANGNLVQSRGGNSAHPEGFWGTPGTLAAFNNLANDF